MKMCEFEASVDSIIKDPEKNFTRFLYDSTEDDLILLLNKLILIPEKGHSTVIQCLLCWQDLMEFEYGLSPVVTELSQSDRGDSVCSALKLINRLIKLAPTTSSRIRIRHELTELRIHDRLEDLKRQFPVNRQLALLREECSFLLRPGGENSPSCSRDCDSGTYSSSEEDMSNNFELSDVDLELFRLLNSNEVKDHRQELVDVLTSIVNNFSSEGKSKLQKIKQVCNQQEIPEENEKIPSDSARPPPPPPEANFLPPPLPKVNPPPPPEANFLPPPPPPPEANSLPPPPPCLGAGPPPPPPLLLKNPNPLSSVPKEKSVIPDALKLPIMPPAGKKFKRLQWTKIPTSTITEQKAKNSIWQRLENVHKAFKNRLHLNQLDELFECSPSQPVSGSNPNNGEVPSKAVKPQILDGKRKMNIGIFLKQFKDMDVLLNNIYQGNIDGIEHEKLKVLESLLPTSSEILTLQNYTGDLKVLEDAETFFMKLIKIPDFQLRISTMTFRADISAFVDDSEKFVLICLRACDELLLSESLRRIFYLFLHMGNYLNADGKTVGFKLNTLWGIDSMRTTKDGLSLLHLVAQRMKDYIDDRHNEMELFQRRFNNVPILEGANLEAFVDEALKDSQKIPVKRSPSPWMTSDNKRDSGIDDSISVNVTSESSTSSEISPTNDKNVNLEKDDPKIFNMDGYIEKEQNSPGSVVKTARKIPGISQSSKSWNSGSSIKENETGSKEQTETKMKNAQLPSRPPMTNPDPAAKPPLPRSATKSLDKSPNPTSVSITARNQALTKVRTLRGTNSVIQSKPESKSSIPNKPSQIRTYGLKKPAESPATTPTTKKPFPNLVSSFKKPAETPTTQRKLLGPSPKTSILAKTDPPRPKPLPKLPTTQNDGLLSSPKSLPSSPRGFGSPMTPTKASIARQSFRSSTNSSTSSSPKKNLTASEKRILQTKPSNSVSTASRPTMIRTGSVSERPRWI